MAMYISNIGERIIKIIYAKGTVTVGEIVQSCIKNKTYFKASEGDYTDEGMISYGVEMQLFYMKEKGCLEFTWDSDLKIDDLDKWLEIKCTEFDGHKDIWKVKVKFAKDWRKHYPNIPILHSIQ
jgi:hypothetical protein